MCELNYRKLSFFSKNTCHLQLISFEELDTNIDVYIEIHSQCYIRVIDILKYFEIYEQIFALYDRNCSVSSDQCSP